MAGPELACEPHGGGKNTAASKTMAARVSTTTIELNIGHAIVTRALFVGLREAVREMKQLLREAAGCG